MKNYFYTILLTLLFFSCKPTMTAQEKNNLTPKKQKIAKPKFGDLVNDKIIAPNIIQLQVSILKEVKPANICNTEYSSTLEVKIIEILESGSSITNMITKNKKYTFVLNNFIKQKAIEKIKSGKTMTITVKEGLCKNANQSLYEVLSF